MGKAVVCPVCRGKGKIDNIICHGCNGKGWVEVKETPLYPYVPTMGDPKRPFSKYKFEQ